MSGRRRGFSWWLGLVTLVALGLRVYYVVFFRFHHLPLSGDAQFYAAGANLLVRGKGFISPFTRHQSAAHPPLYLLYLAIPSLFTHGHATQQVQMLWSCVLGAGTVAMCGLAGREIAGPRVGIVAACLAAVYPNLWVHDGMLLSETMALFTVTMVIYLSYRYYRAPSARAIAWLGLWCGLATLSRAELVLCLPLVVLPLALSTRSIAFATRVRWVLVGGVAALIVVAPWVTFNAVRFRERVYVSTDFGQTLAAANCDAAYNGADLGYKDYPCLHAVMVAVAKPGLDESQIDKAASTVAMKYIDAHRGRVPVVVLARWGRAFGVYHPSTDLTFDIYLLRRSYEIGWSTLYTFYGVAMLAVIGGVMLRRRRTVPLFPMLAMLVIVLAAVATTFGQVRYRAPLEPVLVILASVTLEVVIWPRRARIES